MSLTGDAQNVNVNGNLIITDSLRKIRTPKVEFFDGTVLTTAPSGGILFTGNVNVGSNIVLSDTASNLINLSGNLSANYLFGNAKNLTSLTDAGVGSYGSSTKVSQIVVDATGRVTGISNVSIAFPAVTSNLNDIVTNGNATVGTVLFQGVDTSFVTSGKVGISNVAPTHTLDVGSNLYVSDTGSNVLVTSGNVSAGYYSGNAKYLSSLTDVSTGTYGSGSSIPTISVTDGRITSISTTSINTVATATTGQVAYYTSNGTVGGHSGLAYSSGSQTLSVNGSLSLGGDLFVYGNTYSGNNVVFNDAIVMFGNSYPNGTTSGLLFQRPAGNVMMGYLSSEGGSLYDNTLAFGYTLSGANGPLLTPDTSNLLPVRIFGNLTTTSHLYVGSKTNFFVDSATALVGISNATPGHNLSIGSNLYVSDIGSNVLVTTGNVSASYYSGSAKNLTSLTDAGVGSYGSSTKVSQIVVDATGRVTGISNVSIAFPAVTSNLNDIVTNGNATVGTVLFQGVDTSFVTSGKVGISNVAPTHTLDVGSNLYVSDTGSNVLVVLGNVSASYFTGNAKYLTSLTDAGAGSYGTSTAVSQITIDATGRVTGISNVAIQEQSNLEQVVNRGNVTANTVQFTNATTSLVTSSNVGIGITVPTSALHVVGTSNLFGNALMSNVNLTSISFNGGSGGTVRSITLQDACEVGNTYTAQVTVSSLKMGAQVLTEALIAKLISL